MARHWTSLFLLLLILAAVDASGAEQSCLECHAKISPGAVRHWQESAHADQVGCSECHGDDHTLILQGKAQVTAEVCGRCHPQAYQQHRASRHGMGLHSGWGCTRNLPERNQAECRFCHQQGSTLPLSRIQCARFLEQSSEMGALGCNRCHQVETSCASCHSNHQTAAQLVRDPGVCAKCHMGPDHPQWEAWQTSQHGQLYQVAGAAAGPSCQACHMPGAQHNVSLGITVSPAGKPHPQEQIARARQTMVDLCSDCHAPGFAARELAAADRIRLQSQALVDAAREQIVDLADHSLLQPMPADRPAHPLRGQELVLDGQMLYEDISHIERLFFKMQKYDFAKTWKGAYHQNPAYTHWFGNAEVKMDLVDIKSEALRLRGGDASGAPAALAPPLAAVEARLDVLKKRFERGAIDAGEYARQKQQLLDAIPAAGARQDDDHRN